MGTRSFIFKQTLPLNIDTTLWTASLCTSFNGLHCWEFSKLLSVIPGILFPLLYANDLNLLFDWFANPFHYPVHFIGYASQWQQNCLALPPHSSLLAASKAGIFNEYHKTTDGEACVPTSTHCRVIYTASWWSNCKRALALTIAQWDIVWQLFLLKGTNDESSNFPLCRRWKRNQ